MQKGQTLLLFKIGISNADPAKDITKTRQLPITAPIATYYLQLINGKILFHHYYLSRATQFTYTPALYLLHQTNIEREKEEGFFLPKKWDENFEGRNCQLEESLHTIHIIPEHHFSIKWSHKCKYMQKNTTDINIVIAKKLSNWLLIREHDTLCITLYIS